MRTVNWKVVIIIMLLLAPNLIFLQGQCVQTATSGDEWPLFHYDPAHTGYTDSTAPTTMPEILWCTDTKNPQTGNSPFSPVVVDGVVYAIGNTLDAYNDTTGELIWRQLDAAYSQPAVANGVIYTESQAFNATTGAKIWNITIGLGSGFGSSAAVADGYFYTTAQEGLACFNASTGSSVWSSNYSCYSCPAISNGFIFFGSGNNIVALNAYSGSKLWAHNISPNYERSSPAVEANNVYARDAHGILCLNSITGEEKWNYTLEWSDIWESSPAVAYGCVYIGSGDGNVYSINASTGEKIWNTTTYKTLNSGVESSPAVADGAVYVGSDNNILYAFNAYNGDKLWSYKIGEPQHMYHLHCSPAIAEGRIYIGSEDTFMIAFKTSQPVDNTIIYAAISIAFVIAAVVIGRFVINRYHKKSDRQK